MRLKTCGVCIVTYCFLSVYWMLEDMLVMDVNNMSYILVLYMRLTIVVILWLIRYMCD
jgi:hypothetical protein